MKENTFLPSRNENGILDKIIVEVLKSNRVNYKNTIGKIVVVMKDNIAGSLIQIYQ